MTARPSSSPNLRRPSGVGAAGAGSGLTASLENSAGAADDVVPALSWPPSRETLADLARTHTQDEIAGLCGVQRTAVSKLAQRLGVEWPKEGRRHLKGDGQWPVSRAQLEKWLGEGLSSHDIAKRVNRSHSAVIRLRTKYGLAAAHPKGRKIGAKGDRAWNWRDMSNPKRTNGKFESVEEWLAAGNEPSKCPTAYCAPVISGTPAHGSSLLGSGQVQAARRSH